MSKKSLSTLKLSAAVVILAAGVGVSGITSEAAFDAPYYNINENGGSFNGSQYTLADGTTVTDAFFCDGTYTYFLQTDGTPMKDRLTYHPDGQADHVIYFDADGHECFDTFANVKKSIAGTDVDDLCYFGSLGYLYVNVITYNKAGTAIYYANEYGVMERNGVFEVRSDATNYAALANGCKYGYANSDGTVKGFYATYEEAAAQAGNGSGSTNQQGSWECYESIWYDGEGRPIEHEYKDGNAKTVYDIDVNGNETLWYSETKYYDANGKNYGYSLKNYQKGGNGTVYLSRYEEDIKPENGDWSFKQISYDETGKVKSSSITEYSGSKVLKETGTNEYYNVLKVYNYTNGKLTSTVEDTVYPNSRDINGGVPKYKTVEEYDENENLKRRSSYQTVYYLSAEGQEILSGYADYFYTSVGGKEVLTRQDGYSGNGAAPKLSGYTLYEHDANGNITKEDSYLMSDGTMQLNSSAVRTYDGKGNITKEDIYRRSDGTLQLNSSTTHAYDANGNEIHMIFHSYGPTELGTIVPDREVEYAYAFINNEWTKTKELHYTDHGDGQMTPESGTYNWERYYDNDQLVREISYTSTDNSSWTVKSYSDYTKPDSIVWPQDTTQIVSVESCRCYNPSTLVTAYYIVDNYRFVQK